MWNPPLTSKQGGLVCNVCYVQVQVHVMPTRGGGQKSMFSIPPQTHPRRVSTYWINIIWSAVLSSPLDGEKKGKKGRKRKKKLKKSCQTPPNATQNRTRFPAIHPFTATRWPRFCGQEASGGYLRRISDAQVTRAPQQPNRSVCTLYTPALRVYSRLGNRRQ